MASSLGWWQAYARSEVVPTLLRWRLLAVAAAIALGWTAAQLTDASFARFAVREQQATKAELFQAVHDWLAKANLPPRDMPRHIISFKRVGEQRYHVHMQMGQGTAWFEVWQEDGQWQARGLQRPG